VARRSNRSASLPAEKLEHFDEEERQRVEVGTDTSQHRELDATIDGVVSAGRIDPPGAAPISHRTVYSI